MECCLSTAQRKISALLQVQKEAPVDLLVGTDVLHQLGFVLTQPDRGDLFGRGPEASATGQMTNSQPEEWQTTVNAAAHHTTDPNLPIDRVIVKLIQAARLPAGHSKLIRAGIGNSGVEGDTCLFEPSLETLHTRGLSMADAVVGIGDGGGMTELVLNRGPGPILLEEGDVLGEIQPATLLDTGDMTAEEEVDHGHQVSLTVADISSSTSRAKRERELLTLLDLKSVRVEATELKMLQELVVEFTLRTEQP